MDRKYNILVVDDSETNLMLLEAILEDEGFVVEIAYSAREADKLIQHNIPDLILLDLLMPNENGFDFLRELKSSEKFKDIPIIIVTAFANHENKIIAKDMGAVGVIEKPINIPIFIDKINKVLGITV